MPAFNTIEVEHATTPTIPFVFVQSDGTTPRNVVGATVTFTVFGLDGVTPLFPAKTAVQGATSDVQNVVLSLEDTTRAPGSFYAELQYVNAGETLRWHGTFKIAGV